MLYLDVNFCMRGEELRGLNFSHVTTKKKKKKKMKIKFSKQEKLLTINTQKKQFRIDKKSISYVKKYQLKTCFYAVKFGYVYLICNYSLL